MLVADKQYNEGKYGQYPTHQFKTTIIEPPRLNFMKPFTNCDDGSYIFVAPRGNVAWSAFYILDHTGSMIWGPDHRYGEVYNFQVQTYKGEPFLFFWAGDDSIGGHGEGKYYMLDSHYEEHRQISAGQGIRGDLHAFSITDEETAVFTAYEIMPCNLSSLGRSEDSYIWESLFQELDIDTGKVIFSWRASEHIDFHDMHVLPNRATENDPWDFFHINMVEKDKKGNYLVSTRYGRCALYISGKTGKILWQLGGNKNSFKDLSGGAATTFVGQHDIHWADDYTGITLFDNRGDWYNKIEDVSKGTHIKLDLEKMTAKLIKSYIHPDLIYSTSQGSYQTLSNGDVLIGYGFNGAFTQFTAEGDVLCDAYMQPSRDWGAGTVQSYRNLKFNWTGMPLSTPEMVYEDGWLYMSWLGSTKLRNWLLQDCDTADGLFETVQTTPRVGFETEFKLADGKRMRRFVRAIAVDHGGTQLSISAPVDIIDPLLIWPEPEEHHHEDEADDHKDEYDYDDEIEDVQILLVLGILAAISAVLVAFMTFGTRCIPWRRETSSEKGGIRLFTGEEGGFAIRRVWNIVQSSVRSPKKSWQDFSARRSLLGHQRASSLTGAERVFSNTDYDVDDDQGSESYR